MMAERFLDTNCLIHFLTGNDVAKAESVRAVLLRAEGREEALVTSLPVIIEVAFMLQRHFRLGRSAVAECLSNILMLANLSIDDRQLLSDTVEIYRATGGLSFTDAYNAAYMRRRSIGEVYSWDTDFDRVAGLRRVEPA